MLSTHIVSLSLEAFCYFNVTPDKVKGRIDISGSACKEYFSGAMKHDLGMPEQ